MQLLKDMKKKKQNLIKLADFQDYLVKPKKTGKALRKARLKYQRAMY